MWKYVLPFILILASCHVDTQEFNGVYESKSGNQVEISCSSKFSASIPFDQSNMPKNGEEVTIVPNEETYDICFTFKDVMTSFGKWNPDDNELIIQGVKYKRKKKSACE